MSDELTKNIEKLIEGGYGDSNRLTAILDTIVKGRSLYSSDQKYVDSLISRYLFPSENETDYSKSQSISENSFCPKCGSVISNSSSYCSKCGSSLKTDEK